MDHGVHAMHWAALLAIFGPALLADGACDLALRTQAEQTWWFVGFGAFGSFLLVARVPALVRTVFPRERVARPVTFLAIAIALCLAVLDVAHRLRTGRSILTK